MHRVLFVALSTGAFLGSACTNDYDALLDQASGGGSAASTSDAASTSAEASSSSGAPGSSTSTSVSASSASSAGDGGNGDGGDGNGGSGDGGNGNGGSGNGGNGGGDVLPGADPCPGYEADFTKDIDDISFEGSVWSVFHDGSNVDVDTTEDQLRVRLRDGGNHLGGLVAALTPAQLDGCSIATSATRLPPSEDLEQKLVGVFLGVSKGPIGQAYIGVERTDTKLQLVARRIGSNETPDMDLRPPAALDGAPPYGLRLRAVEGTLYFDVQRAEGEGWTAFAEIPLAQIEDGFDVVSLGGSRDTAENDNDDLEVRLGSVNLD